MKNVEGRRFPNEKGQMMQVSSKAAGEKEASRRLRRETGAGTQPCRAGGRNRQGGHLAEAFSAMPGAGRPRKALPQAEQLAAPGAEERLENHNHALDAWCAPALEGRDSGRHLKMHRNFLHPYHLLPVNGLAPF